MKNLYKQGGLAFFNISLYLYFVYSYFSGTSICIYSAHEHTLEYIFSL